MPRIGSSRIATLLAPALELALPFLFLLTIISLATTSLHADTSNTFTNPIFKGEDPYLTKGPDGYYHMAADTNSKDNSIVVYRSKSLIHRGVGKKVYVPPSSGTFSDQFWAPEIHHIDGCWYIYTCADNGDNANHRLVVLKADTNDSQGSYQFATTLETPGWAIDSTVFRAANDQLYCVWSGWPQGVPADSTQHLFISAMSDPLHLVGPAIDISGEMLDWEKNGRPDGLNEAPQVLQRNGKICIVYSASGSWTADYCLGLLTCKNVHDLLNPDAWIKHTQPLLQKQGNIYGPGHCCFTKSPDDTEDWIAYHSSFDPEGSWNRGVSIKKFTWSEDGTPHLGSPSPWGEEIPVPAGELSN